MANIWSHSPAAQHHGERVPVNLVFKTYASKQLRHEPRSPLISRTEVMPQEVNLFVLKVQFVVQEPVDTCLGPARPLFDRIYKFPHVLSDTRVSLVYRSFCVRNGTGWVFTRSRFTTGHHGDNLSFGNQVFFNAHTFRHVIELLCFQP